MKKNSLHQSPVWVSDLALVQSQGTGAARGVVMNALSGKPISEATVERWQQNDRGGYVKSTEVRTNDEGVFDFPKVARDNYLYRVIYNDDSLVGERGWMYERGSDKANQVIHLFTDRAIYRPGQTVRFKGIATWYDRTKNDYHTVADKDFTVIFSDANNKEIAQVKVRSNRLGSFNGSFTAPTDRVLGRASIRCERNSAMVRIEEYKRPKFSVEVGAAKAPPRLGEKVTVVAKATAYTGAAIDGAKVKWTVTRRAQWPEWSRWCWWFNPGNSGSKQIAHGTAVTGTNGEVEVTFTAEPDLSVDPKNEPILFMKYPSMSLIPRVKRERDHARCALPMSICRPR